MYTEEYVSNTGKAYWAAELHKFQLFQEKITSLFASNVAIENGSTALSSVSWVNANGCWDLKFVISQHQGG